MWQSLYARLFADFFAHDPSQLTWASGLRNALGIVLPLVIGFWSGHIGIAGVIAVGAIVTGFAGLTGTWPKRMRAMAWATVWVGAAAYLGVLSGGHPVPTLVLVAVSGGVAGILVGINPEMSPIGTLATNSLIIFSGLAPNPSLSGDIALEVMAGGALQLLLVGLSRRFQPLVDGTNSLKAALAYLAQYTRHATRELDLAAARSLVVAETRVNDHAIAPDRRRRLAELLFHLDLARNDIVALKTLARIEGIPAWNADLEGAIADVLDGLRRELSRSKTPDPRMLRHTLQSHLASLHSNEASLHLNHLIQTLDTLYGLASQNAAPDRVRPAAPSPPAHAWWRDLRAHLTLRSAALRHALRLMGTLAVAEWVFQRWHIPHGYWIPLTAVVILKPDFFSTVGRGIARMAGTLLGVLVGTGLVFAAGHQTPWTVIAILAMAWGMYTVLNFNYPLFSLLISAEIVILLTFIGQIEPVVAMHSRLVATVAGSLLALGAYAAFPTWQRSQVPSTLAQWVEAERRYLGAILENTTPWIYRRETRLSRVQSAALIESALNEPSPERILRSRVLRWMTELHGLTEILMSLELRLEQEPRPLDPAFMAFGQNLGERMRSLQNDLRSPARKNAPPHDAGRSPGSIRDPFLDAAAQQLQDAVDRMAQALPVMPKAGSHRGRP